MDVAARVLLAVEKMINDKILPKYVDDRYSNWNNELGTFIHDKNNDLESIASKVINENLEPKPKSGQQELLENILNKYL